MPMKNPPPRMKGVKSYATILADYIMVVNIYFRLRLVFLVRPI